MRYSETKKMIFGAVCIALCVIVPMAFHTIPNSGTIFLPMHIPVLLCGLACGWPYGLLCGILGPVLSSLLTGMPPALILPAMAVECAVYGCVSGILMKLVRTGSVYADLYISMGIAMVIGRIVAGLVKAFILAPNSMTLSAWATAYFVTGIPGIIIQLVIIPTLVFALMKAKLLPLRYSKQ